MKRLADVSLEDIFTKEMIDDYQFLSSPTSTLSEFIYDYMTSRPGFISQSEHEKMRTEEEKTFYIDIFDRKTLAGKPIEIFALLFDPKPKRRGITNGQFYPDMGEFLTLLHFTLIAKHIRDVYDPGFRFILAYEGTYFRRTGGFSKEETENVYRLLQFYRDHAERMVGIRNVIQFEDLEEIVRPFRSEHDQLITEQISEIQHTPEMYQELAHYLLTEVINTDQHTTTEEAERFAKEEAIRMIAFGQVIDQGGETGEGIFHAFPNVISANAQMGYREEAFEFQLLPDSITVPYNFLTVRTVGGKWALQTWDRMQEDKYVYEPVFIEEIPHPFYYQQGSGA